MYLISKRRRGGQYVSERNTSQLREVVIENKRTQRILKSCHEGYECSKAAEALSSPRGRDKMIETISLRYHWPNLSKNVIDYCKTCPTCQKVNPKSLKVIDSLKPIPVPKEIMSQIGVDLAQLPEVDGQKYIVFAIDYFF